MIPGTKSFFILTSLPGRVYSGCTQVISYVVNVSIYFSQKCDAMEFYAPRFGVCVEKFYKFTSIAIHHKIFYLCNKSTLVVKKSENRFQYLKFLCVPLHVF